MSAETSPKTSGFNLGLLLSGLALPPLLFVGNPALGLLAGAAITIGLNQPVVAEAARWGKICLQTAIVLIGLRLNLQTVWALSADYSSLVAGYVVLTLILGVALARLLRVDKVPGQLIAAGTAICGGTAIACLSPLLGARPHEMAVPLGLVFLLNVIALFAFPLIGHWLDLSQLEFGLWSALAIHDTSSVVATAAVYGPQAEEVATTIKLGRTLWLIPLMLGVAIMAGRRDAKLRLPFFIVLFVLAAAAGSFFELPALALQGAAMLSKGLLVVALFLVGTELSRETVRGIRGRVLWQAIALWLTVAPLTLLAIYYLPA